MSYLENRYNCSGICKVPLFYFSHSIELGPPTQTCLPPLTQELSIIFRDLGLTLLGTSIVLLSMLICMLPICCFNRRKEVDEELAELQKESHGKKKEANLFKVRHKKNGSNRPSINATHPEDQTNFNIGQVLRENNGEQQELVDELTEIYRLRGSQDASAISAVILQVENDHQYGRQGQVIQISEESLDSEDAHYGNNDYSSSRRRISATKAYRSQIQEVPQDRRPPSESERPQNS